MGLTLKTLASSEFCLSFSQFLCPRFLSHPQISLSRVGKNHIYLFILRCEKLAVLPPAEIFGFLMGSQSCSWWSFTSAGGIGKTEFLDRQCLSFAFHFGESSLPHQGHTAATQATVVAVFGVQPLEQGPSDLTLVAALPCSVFQFPHGKPGVWTSGALSALPDLHLGFRHLSPTCRWDATALEGVGACRASSNAGHSARRCFRSRIHEGRLKEWWMLDREKNRLRGDVITDFGFRGDVIWRMATSCSPSPVRIERVKIDRNCSRWT